MDDILQKLKKVVRMVLYGPAISQSDCRKTGPYQLPFNEELYRVKKYTRLMSHKSDYCIDLRNLT